MVGRNYIPAAFLNIFILLAITASAQQSSSEQIDATYKNAVKLLQERKVFDANTEFEKVLKLDSNHVQSLYSLGKINEALGDSATAVKFLLRGTRLHDARAKKLLADRYKYKLTYADTMQGIPLSVSQAYKKLPQQVSSFDELFQLIQSSSTDKRQQLQILLLWIHDVLTADSRRFFNGGNPLSNYEVFAKHIGLCDEYSNVVKAFCNTAGIPNYKVLGYVKYPGFGAGDKFTETNHAWNAVFLNSSWLLCDSFWSTIELASSRSMPPHFNKRLEPKYFLARPEDFIIDHLPADPVFQFSNHPIAIEAFTKKEEGIDTSIPRMTYMNYADSLNTLGKMKPDDREWRMAERSLIYNRSNPNYVIVQGYNYGVEIVNSKRSTKQDLLKAKAVFSKVLSVIDQSSERNIKALKPACQQAIVNITNYLATIK